LVLDEPGNHLDVETVESLVEALLEYRGTVIFTSHDRHFMRRLATNIIEVRDGSAKNYGGDYEAYLYYINKEIEEGERTRAPTRSKAKKEKVPEVAAAIAPRIDDRVIQKELKNIERTIRTLDTQRTELNQKLMTTTDAAEALKIHNEVKALEMELGVAEERWLELHSY